MPKQLTIPLPSLAVHGPVVVAVIVHRSLAVKEQSVLAGLQRESAVGAKEELVAILGVRVRLLAVLFGALRGAYGKAMCCN